MLNRLRRYANPHSAFENSTNVRSTKSNARTRSMIEAASCPYAPTFCTGVPPTVPGIPAMHSVPAHSSATARPTNSSHNLAGSNAKKFPIALDSLQRNVQHQARKSLVGDDHVAAAAQNKQRNFALAGPVAGLYNLGLARCLREPPRRAANAQGCKSREKLSFYDPHRSKATPRGPHAIE